jgi:hypothetical protein
MVYTIRKQFNYYRLDIQQLRKDLRQIIFEAKPNKNICVVLDDISEDSKYTESDDQHWALVDKEFKTHNISYCIVTNVRNKNYKFPCNNVAFSGVQLMTYYHQYYGKNKNKISDQWNYNSGRGLYIPGKIERFSRTVLMYELYKNSMLSYIDWSYIVSPRSKQVIRQELLHHLTEDEFENFISHCHKSLDIDPMDPHRSSFTKNLDFIVSSPWPYDPKIYSNTSFSIVSETAFYSATLTEKTFRPILNKHPFIILGCINTLKSLDELGFKTFREYLPIDYDSIVDDYERLRAVISCIQYFKDNYSKYINDIQLDLEHNFNRFNEMVKEDITQIESILPKEVDPRTQFDWTYIRHC